MADSSPDELVAASTAYSPSTIPSLKSLPRPLSIRHSQSYDPTPLGHSRRSSSTDPRKSLTTSRSSNSLSFLSSPTSLPPTHPSFVKSNTPNSASDVTHEYELRSQVSPLRTSPFTNPFRKLQNTFGGKKSLDLSGSNGLLNNNNNHNSNSKNNNNSLPKQEKVVSSSSSAGSLNSWRSKGAEILSKSWGRSRKNSEPLLSNSPGPISSQPIFGANLEDAIRISHIPDTPMIPAVLFRCTEFLEAKGIDEVGLYRVPGSHANVQKLKRMFDTGKDYNLLAMETTDPNDIATLLKLYLREQQFQSLLTTDRHICHTLRGILIRLPRPNYVVLSYLCHHLSKIASYSDKTKMTVSNLGVVFAPTLSIGSVLFKALLGGFFDGPDTPENREKGLKIVWGGLLQDAWLNGNENEGYGQSSLPGDKEEYQDLADLSSATPFQQQPEHWIRHQQSLPTMSHYTGQHTNDQSYHPVTHLGIGPLDLCPPVSTIISEIPRNDLDEESQLMQAMLLKEQMAVTESEEVSLSHEPESKGAITIHDTLLPSHTTSIAEAMSNQITTSSATSSILDTNHNNPSTTTTPAIDFDKPSSLHITTNTGEMSNTLISKSTNDVAPPATPLNDPLVPQSISGASQLPMPDSVLAL
ncbi:hypothetical protein FBU30_002032 [Linnemannia zychae]|nr:hypothetical protein FBU30_002032 [Linnemannia zychae]